MPAVGEAMGDDEASERRGENRTALVADCELKSGESRFPAQLQDLGSQGCRFTCDEALNPGDRITLHLHADFAPVAAEVVWCRNLTHGAKFEERLDGALKDTLLALRSQYGERLETQIRDDD